MPLRLDRNDATNVDNNDNENFDTDFNARLHAYAAGRLLQRDDPHWRRR